MRTPGGHRRITEADIAKHLRAPFGAESRDHWTISSRKIREGNQLAGRILGIEVDGLIAQVTTFVGAYRLSSLHTSDLACAVQLKIGDE